MSAKSQLPRLHVAPKWGKTFGDIAASFSSAYDLIPDPWQQVILDDWLAEKSGKWAALTCGVSVARQNGKNAVLEIREIFGMVGRGEKILHTAHQVKTAQKHFRRLKHFFGNKVNDPGAKFPELNELVTEVRNVNGQEAIYLRNGGSVEIVARSQGSGRGFTVDVIVCDEAQDMSDDDQEALLSTSSASPLRNPQWIYTGTPPGPKAAGEVFSRIRGEALEGKARRVAWHEWSCDPATVDLDSREDWSVANPGLESGRLQLAVIEGERANLSEEGFMRERLGMWSGADSRSVIPAQLWLDAGDDFSVAVDRFALGVEVAPDMERASVALAGQRDDGAWHVELDEAREGVDWLVPYVTALLEANPQIRAVVADAGGPVAPLIEQRGPANWVFKGTRVSVYTPRSAELAAGCASLLAGVVTGEVRHTRQGQVGTAVSGAGKRAFGTDTGMWVWSRKSAAVDITPVQAITLALIGAQADQIKRKPFRRVKDASERRAVVL